MLKGQGIIHEDGTPLNQSEYNKRRYNKKKKLKLCEKCSESSNSFSNLCEKHYQIKKETSKNYQSRQYLESKEQGICTWYNCNELPILNGTQCNKHRDADYFRDIFRKFGWTKKEYNQLLESQNWECGNPKCHNTIGTQTRGRMHLDHDEILYQAGFKHESVRALLCNGCNTSTGQMEESIEKIKGLAWWLELQHKRRNEILGVK